MAHTAYLLACAGMNFYAGYTPDITRRVLLHETGRGAKYTLSLIHIFRESTARALCAAGAEWLIVGGAVCNAPDARAAAAAIRMAMQGKGL